MKKKYIPLRPSKANMDSSLTNNIHLFCQGIPMQYALRELVQNGIEANNRNKDDDENVVIITTDHREQYKNKLCIINIGGDTLTEKEYTNHLLDLANSGNSHHEDKLYDTNKGIGAKVSVLPYNHNGVCYVSTHKDCVYEDGTQYGIKTTIAYHEGLYQSEIELCPFTEEETKFPEITDIHPMLQGKSGTSVTLYGHTDEQDTFSYYDKLCSLQKESGGSGYSKCKWLDHRYFRLRGTKVYIHKRSIKDNKHTGYQEVKGMLNTMNNYCYVHNNKKLYGVEELDYNGTKIKAHWCAIYLEKDGVKYNSNKISHGFTALAYKDELYHKYHAKKNSKTSSIKQCGLIIEPQRYVVVFELPNEMDLFTNAQRTKLFVDHESSIDIKELHNLFSCNIPDELKEFMSSLYEDSNANTIEDFLKEHMKKINKLNKGGFGSVKLVEEKRKYTIRKLKDDNNNDDDNQDDDNQDDEKTTITRKKKDRSKSGHMSLKQKLRELIPPQVILIDDEDEELAQFIFNGNNNSIILNKASPIFKNREKYILNEIPSASADIIQQAIKFIVSAAIIERAIEVDNSFSVKEIVQEKLQPDKLEALCTCGLDSRIKSLVLKLIKEHNATSTAA